MDSESKAASEAAFASTESFLITNKHLDCIVTVLYCYHFYIFLKTNNEKNSDLSQTSESGRYWLILKITLNYNLKRYRNT